MLFYHSLPYSLEIGSLTIPGPGSQAFSCLSLPHSARVTGTHRHAQPFIWVTGL